MNEVIFPPLSTKEILLEKPNKLGYIDGQASICKYAFSYLILKAPINGLTLIDLMSK